MLLVRVLLEDGFCLSGIVAVSGKYCRVVSVWIRVVDYVLGCGG